MNIRSVFGWAGFVCIFFLSVPCVFAQDHDRSSSDSGVLVSSPTRVEVSDHDGIDNDGSSDAADFSGQDNSNSSVPQKKEMPDQDPIVDKATNAVIFQMTANLKLTPEQISAVGPIIADNIVKTRDLQKSLEDGTIESSAMFSQRQQLIGEENTQLGSILTPAQMKTWMNIQNQSDDSHSNRSSSK